jgi:hypothetical protein
VPVSAACFVFGAGAAFCAHAAGKATDIFIAVLHEWHSELVTSVENWPARAQRGDADTPRN